MTENFSDHKNCPIPRIAHLCDELDKYLSSEQVREIYRAYLFSAEAHEFQYRIAGEHYIYHPVAVAFILAEMRLDQKCIMAALLHDVIEDTGVLKEALAREFDNEVADLVDGVSKITQIDFKDQAQAQAANLDKMLLAMTRDIRVILIKLADRLHNMRTLGPLRRDKAKRIAKETLEIYSPIANRLGINNICLELENMGFRYYYPWRYCALKNALEKFYQHRDKFIHTVTNIIQTHLHQEIIVSRVINRKKHLYGIYRKMQDKHRNFADIVDVYGIRIITDKLNACYLALGIVHNLYKPVPGKFKDYIAIPKTNGYQSLHTLVIGPGGTRIEIQIRTEEMEKLSESGIAAHWIYKSSLAPTKKIHVDWQQNLLEIKQNSCDPTDFFNKVKLDLFQDQVYVLSPQGKIFELPKNATTVDFAYAVHTDIGNTCVGAKVNYRLVPLRTVLRSGQTVTIITAPNAKPQAHWLNFVVTNKARDHILQYLKHQESQQACELGKSLLDKEMLAANLTWEQISPQRQTALFNDLNIKTKQELWRQVGLGHFLPRLIAWKLSNLNNISQSVVTPQSNERFVIRGSEGVVVIFSKCCHPIVGDNITGILNPGRGLVIHRQSCRNLGDTKRQEKNCLAVEWEKHVAIDLPTEIRVDIGNQRGALATVATVIANNGSNIEDIRFNERDGLSANIVFLISVHDKQHLAKIVQGLQALTFITHVERVFH
jgi:RelA/SpoT family (p)ppGpp synthetase